MKETLSQISEYLQLSANALRVAFLSGSIAAPVCLKRIDFFTALSYLLF